MPPAMDLEDLYDHHAQALFAFLLNLTRNEEDTKDLLQEVFIKLARQPAALEGMREPRAYLLRLAHNSAIDFFRRRAAREKYHEQFGADCPEIFESSADADELAFRQALSWALRDIPIEQRAVVHLKLWDGLTFENIAQI